ncbi:putative 2-dehydropantoate 2-reductase family protein [Dactylonectria estremocensis]|uniref:2-dehydropantoate 2-reductase n=1 Tax=Dactylonectria estremocensis TaxID=1079267 RepID=A0A9P9FD70_9HYPO|nr:putative 2-dehydropantoate 2-reductase family protein [Dactylonectria estremocensis]
MGYQGPLKKQVLLLGSGGVGTIGALNLEVGGQANVTAVLRSNFKAVADNGFNIKSCDHGHITGWRPSHIVSHVPTITERQFDYIVVTTKNVPDCPPTVSDLIAPAVIPGRTTIVLIQNGLNVELPIFERFPDNICLSGVSMIGSHEVAHGVIDHEDPDELILGAFHNPKLDKKQEEAAAKQFIEMYSAGGKTVCTFAENVPHSRWRKLIYNACLNSTCALTGLDSGRIRLANDAVATLVRPAMEEIRAAAAAVGVELDTDVCDTMINLDPLTMYLLPSMQVDVQKGNFTEVENLVGEPLRTGTGLGVPMPTLTVLYHLLKAIQWKTREKRGLVTIPPRSES